MGTAERTVGIWLIIISMTIMSFVLFSWNGKYVEQDIYEYDTEYQCLINDEWTEVDMWSIDWGSDWYIVDGVKTYIQGSELQCNKERTTTYIETKETYHPGVKDFIMFWKWGD